jgi:hypothetical protein
MPREYHRQPQSKHSIRKSDTSDLRSLRLEAPMLIYMALALGSLRTWDVWLQFNVIGQDQRRRALVERQYSLH